MHLASGDIDVQRGTLSKGTQGVDETVAMMVDMAHGEYGAKSAKLRALALNIINDAQVGDKDYYGMAKAIHNWVRDNIRYVKDPVGQETLSYPEETAFNSKGGDCDDKVILEIGLLGTIGIRAYPVVIGVQPGHFSHVYLNIIIPVGGRPGTHAGDHIPADPIMREWPLGQEAPAHKITQKKTYEDLAGLDTMLGAYQTGPSYIDQRNVASVERAMNAALVDTASRGEILNAPKVEEHNTDELDQMFTEPAAIVMQSVTARRLGPYGPITGAEASGSYLDDTTAPKYTVARARGDRSFAPRSVRVKPRLKGVAPAGVMYDKVNDLPDGDDVAGLGVYIDSIIGGALNGEPMHNAIVVHLAKRRAAHAGFIPGMDGLGAELAKKAAALDALAKAGTNGDIYSDARNRLKGMERTGLIKQVEKRKAPLTAKVTWIGRALWNFEYKAPREILRDEPAAKNIDPRLYNPIPQGGIVRRRPGAIPMDGLGGGFFKKIAGSVKKTIKRVVPSPIRKVGSKVLNYAGTVTGVLPLAATGILGKGAMAGAKQAAVSAFGKKLGTQIYKGQRILGVAEVAAAAVIIGAATAGVGPFAAAAPAGALTAEGTASAVAIEGAPISGAMVAPGFMGVTFASGATAIVPATALSAALATGGAATVAAGLSTGAMLAIGAGVVGAGALASTMLSKKKPKKLADQAGNIQYTDANGNPITEAQYNALMAQQTSQQSQQDLATQSYQNLPTQPDMYDPYNDQGYDPNAQNYGGTDLNDPTAGAGAPYAGQPVDSFGPQDAGPASFAESATEDYSGGGADQFMSEGGGGGDEGGQLVDDSDSGGGYADDETEGAPAPRRPRARGRMTTQQVEVPAEADEGVAPEEDVYADEEPEASEDDLDTETTSDDRDVGGVETGVSLTTVALVAVGAYLLLRKKR